MEIKETDAIDYTKGLLDGVKKGRKEVVEFVIENRLLYQRASILEKWERQLNKWGLEERKV